MILHDIFVLFHDDKSFNDADEKCLWVESMTKRDTIAAFIHIFLYGIIMMIFNRVICISRSKWLWKEWFVFLNMSALTIFLLLWSLLECLNWAPNFERFRWWNISDIVCRQYARRKYQPFYAFVSRELSPNGRIRSKSNYSLNEKYLWGCTVVNR